MHSEHAVHNGLGHSGRHGLGGGGHYLGGDSDGLLNAGILIIIYILPLGSHGGEALGALGAAYHEDDIAKRGDGIAHVAALP